MTRYILIFFFTFFLLPCSAQNKVKLVVSAELNLDSLETTINNAQEIEIYFFSHGTEDFNRRSVKKFNSILAFLEPNLKSIFISNFPYKTIDTCFNRFNSLESIEFYRCLNLETLPAFNPSNLKSIDFSDCPKLELKALFSILQSTENCNIGFLRCRLLELPEEILEVKSIKSLQINSNGLPLIVPLKLFTRSNMALFNYAGTEILLRSNRSEIIEYLNPKVTILDK
jgi:hypothetical protein